MSIQQAEELKKEWTDKCVQVRKHVPELRRFEGLVGRVRTVNMNCRLLVQFDTPADISWYDISPRFLTVVATDAADSATASTNDSSDPVRQQATAVESQPANIKDSRSTLEKIRTQTGAGRVTARLPGSRNNPLNRIREQAALSKTVGAAEQVPDAASEVRNVVDDSPNDVSTAAVDVHIAEAPSTGDVKSADEKHRSSHRTSVPEPRTVPAPRLAVDSTTAAADDHPRSSVFEQIYAQAAADSHEQRSRANDSIFDQVRRQAADDQVAAGEHPVKQSFHGKKLPKKDDLRVVEGIGPKIEELLRANGITTWNLLADTSVDRLSEVLRNAGPRFHMHSPATWPDQARLAADGQWKRLEELQSQLAGGRKSN